MHPSKGGLLWSLKQKGRERWGASKNTNSKWSKLGCTVLSLLISMVLTLSTMLSRLGILSGNGRMAILEKLKKMNEWFVMRGKSRKTCVVLINWAESECFLFPISTFPSVLILLLPFVGAVCCFLSHHVVSLMTSPSPSRRRLCCHTPFHQDAHSLVLVSWPLR